MTPQTVRPAGKNRTNLLPLFIKELEIKALNKAPNGIKVVGIEVQVAIIFNNFYKNYTFSIFIFNAVHF